MRGRKKQSTTPLPEAIDPFEELVVYRVTEAGKRALAEYERAHGRRASREVPATPAVADALAAVARRERRRSLRARARERGRRLLTVCGRGQGGPKLPDLRMRGRWLEAAGFPLGQEYEVEVEPGRLTLRAV